MTKRLVTAGLICAFAAAAAQPQPQAAPAADPGRALLDRVCTSCHELSGVMSQRNTRDRWSEIVDDMASRGAEATDEDLAKIVDYLAKTRGPRVNINRAGTEELIGTVELPKATASAIVEYRDKNGNFKTLDDLKKIPGIDWNAIESKKDRLDFGPGK